MSDTWAGIVFVLALIAALALVHKPLGDYMALGNMSFAAPSQSIGGGEFEGEIRDIRLTIDVDEVSAV